ncbi:unnamed protein product, partial [Vitis vinifera]
MTNPTQNSPNQKAEWFSLDHSSRSKSLLSHPQNQDLGLPIPASKHPTLPGFSLAASPPPKWSFLKITLVLYPMDPIPELPIFLTTALLASLHQEKKTMFSRKVSSTFATLAGKTLGREKTFTFTGARKPFAAANAGSGRLCWRRGWKYWKVVMFMGLVPDSYTHLWPSPLFLKSILSKRFTNFIRINPISSFRVGGHISGDSISNGTYLHIHMNYLFRPISLVYDTGQYKTDQWREYSVIYIYYSS